jgi:hypothetical protein
MLMGTIFFEFTPPPSIPPGTIRDGAFNLFQAHGDTFDARLKIERMSGRPGVNRRTSNLATGWNVQTISTDTTITTTNWLSGPAAEQDGRHGYGWVQENGADIVPVKGKYLWIPTEENMTPTGVARISPTEAIDQGGFFAKGVFFGKTQTKGQKASSMAIKGAVGYKGHVFAGGEKIVPLFILKIHVRVDPRLGATELWNSMIPDLESGLDQLVQAAA